MSSAFKKLNQQSMTSINCVPLGKRQFRLLFQYSETAGMTIKKVEQDIVCVLEKYIDDSVWSNLNIFDMIDL